MAPWTQETAYPKIWWRTVGSRLWSATLLCLMQAGMVVLAIETPYQTLDRLEQSLYAKQYDQQTIGQRLTRLEISLFGQMKPGPSNQRLHALHQHILQLQGARETQLEQARTLNYLETRFGPPMASTPTPVATPERLERLEETIYGTVQADVPVDERLRRLRQTVPLHIQKVRVEAAPTSTVTPLPAINAPTPPMPEGTALLAVPAQLPSTTMPSTPMPPTSSDCTQALPLPLGAPVQVASKPTTTELTLAQLFRQAASKGPRQKPATWSERWQRSVLRWWMFLGANRSHPAD